MFLEIRDHPSCCCRDTRTVNTGGIDMQNTVIGVPSNTKNIGLVAARSEKTVRLPPFVGESEIVLVFSLAGKDYSWRGGYIEQNGLLYRQRLMIGGDGAVEKSTHLIQK